MEQMLKTAKNLEILKEFYRKELYRRLLFIVTNDTISNHREKALEYFKTIIETINEVSDEISVILPALADRMNKLPFAEPQEETRIMTLELVRLILE